MEKKNIEVVRNKNSDEPDANIFEQVNNQLNAEMALLVPKLDRLDQLYQNLYFENDLKLAQEEQALTHSITIQFKQCMKTLTMIKNAPITDSQHKVIIDNIWRRGANKLNELSKRIHRQQDRRKELIVPDFDNIIEMQPISSGLEQSLLFKQQDFRHQEILKLNQDVNELLSLFQQLDSMITEQGTILDNISYNLENAQQQVSTATQQVVGAEKEQKKGSSFSNKLILGLGALVIGLGTVLGLKKR